MSRDWINDGLVILFFFLVALELEQELVPGELNDLRMAALSIAVTLGAVGVAVVRIMALAGFVGIAVGKPTGILTFSWLALRSGIAIRPPEPGWRLLAGGGLLAGIGFTMALFIANPAFSRSLIDSAKPGIFLASLVSAMAGIALLSGLSGYGKLSYMARQ